MAAPYDELPFKRGKTLYGGTPSDTAYQSPITGQEYSVRDDIHLTGRAVVVRAVKNKAGFAVLPKRLARLSVDGTQILGYTRLPSERGYPIDQLLPSGGCADNDTCFVVVRGPCLVLTDLANYSADVAARDLLTSQTAATSGATTAGRVILRAVAAATADATAGQRNITTADGVFGMAASASLTNSTNADLLVYVGHGWVDGN